MPRHGASLPPGRSHSRPKVRQRVHSQEGFNVLRGSDADVARCSRKQCHNFSHVMKTPTAPHSDCTAVTRALRPQPRSRLQPLRAPPALLLPAAAAFARRDKRSCGPSPCVRLSIKRSNKPHATRHHTRHTRKFSKKAPLHCFFCTRLEAARWHAVSQ